MPANNSMPTPSQVNRRNAHLRKLHGLTYQDVKALATENGLTPKDVYDSLDKAIKQAKDDKKKATQEAAKNRTVVRNLSKNLTELIHEQPIKPERMVQVHFRVFREDTRNVRRMADRTIGGRLRLAHKYIEIDNEYYLGEDDERKLTILSSIY